MAQFNAGAVGVGRARVRRSPARGASRAIWRYVCAYSAIWWVDMEGNER